MISSGRFFQQILRHFRREKRLSLGSFLVLAIALIMFDLFWLASININEQYRQILSQVHMELYLTDELPDSLTSTVETALYNLDAVDSVIYLSKEDAARILENDLGPGLLDVLESNPLPRSYIILFNRTLTLEELDRLQGSLMEIKGVDSIEFGRSWIEKIEDIGDTLNLVGYFIGGLILFVVLLTMANTNRLTARSKSRDFFQLKLLGAGPSYLIYPFLAEGFVSAFVAAGLGWLVILYIADQVSFQSFTLINPGNLELIIYCLLAGLTGMVGAYLGIRRFIVHE